MSTRDVSMRHFPDELSDESASFQIPVPADSSNLLDDIEDDFFGGAIDSINTPMPPKTTNVRDPSPRPANPVEANISTIMPSVVGPDSAPTTSDLVAPPPRVRKHAILSSRDATGSLSTDRSIPATDNALQHVLKSARVSILGAKPNNASNQNTGKPVQGVNPKETVHLPAAQESIATTRPKSKQKPTIIGGGIVKRPKQAASKPTNPPPNPAAHHPVPQLSISSRNNVSEQEDSATAQDVQIATSLTSSGRGVARKLLVIGQTLMNTMASSSRVDVKEANLAQTSTQLVGETEKPPQILEPRGQRNDDPFTLSQLSPRKVAERGSRPNQPDDVPIPVSPMRPSKKRTLTATEAADDILRNESQKERIVDLNRAEASGSGGLTLQPSRTKNGVASSSSHVLENRLKGKAAPSRQSPKRKGRGHAVVSSRSQLGSSLGSGKCEKPRAARKLNASHPIRKPGQIPSFDKTSTALPPFHKTTNPIGFRFELDARMEGRNTELDEKGSRKRPKVHHGSVTAIPDFKASHAALGASFAARREHRAPIVPLGFSFSTEVRAQERERFDEQVRAKQEEVERQREDERKQREIEEEVEMKEMRKRAVPKANQVPEWYTNMPKRKGHD